MKKIITITVVICICILDLHAQSLVVKPILPGLNEAQGGITIATIDSNVYLSGNSNHPYLLRRDHSQNIWDTLVTSNSSGVILSMISDAGGNNLYMAGSFANLNSISTIGSIAKLDVQSGNVSAINFPFTHYYEANRKIIFDPVDSSLIVAGRFAIQTSNGDTASLIARLNLQTGIVTKVGDISSPSLIWADQIWDLAFSGGYLYATGAFYTSINPSGYPIARFDLSNGVWDSAFSFSCPYFGVGKAIKFLDKRIFIGGSSLFSYDTISGLWKDYPVIAGPSGQGWPVLSMDVWNGDLYAGGSFTSIGGSPMTTLGYLKDGDSVWNSCAIISSSVPLWEANVACIAHSKDHLYFTGFFDGIDGFPAENVGEITVLSSVGISNSNTREELNVYPNPVNLGEKVRINVPSKTHCEISNTKGQVILKQELSVGVNEINPILSSGLYIISIGDRKRLKLIVQ